MISGKYVKTVTVVDPDSGGEVDIAIYKMETGGMVGVDESFLMNTDEPLFSPYDAGVELNLD
jgi:hypothetical protein